MDRITIVALLALSAVACKGDADEEADKRGRLPTFGPVYGVPNFDDDDDNGRDDWKDEGAADDNDLVPLPVDELESAVLGDDYVNFALVGSASVRLWNGDAVVLDDDTREGAINASDVSKGLAVEFGDYAEAETLVVTTLDTNGAAIESVEIQLHSAPAILNHHLQPFERAFAVKDGGGNQSMVDDMKDVMGDAFITRNAADYQFDVWVQDEFENATLTSPTSRVDLVIDSIRSDGFGLDPYPEKVVAKGGDIYVDTWGSGYASSQDSFGNLEVSPPVTVGGVEYPFGRIYYGDWDYGLSIHRRLANFLDDQRVQRPFTLDVSWLCVGHVDEFTTFLPDPTAPKGFRLYVADVPEAYAFLEGLPPDHPLPRYAPSKGYASVGEVLADRALRALNDDIQRDFIDMNVDRMKLELGLDDADIVRVPGMFEELGLCGPYGLAFIPATVNMLVSTGEGGQVEAFIPDPFFRSEGVPQADDPFIQQVNALLPDNVTPHWVDGWYTYHLGWGEIHCGTNTTRTPTANWWEDAMHLLEEGE